ncbi:hypothetical protein [Dethiothermospora halolimnae]|uniref:hypothetical protein n=1 Tax=Dethiothermospora halolimnae TaxID=3114390 RepID=UPI003CCB8A31
MFIRSDVAFAVKCEICGKVKVQKMSLFDIRKGKGLKLYCNKCKQHNATIKTVDFKSFSIEVPCFACQDTHIFRYSLKELISDRKICKCPETGMEILFIGKHDNINTIVQDHKEDSNLTINELGFYDYFNNPETMMRVINIVRKLEMEEKIYCDCGIGDIDINLFPDRVELNCSNCNSIQVIYAENETDLHNIMDKEGITMHKNSFGCIDAINFRD